MRAKRVLLPLLSLHASPMRTEENCGNYTRHASDLDGDVYFIEATQHSSSGSIRTDSTCFKCSRMLFAKHIELVTLTHVLSKCDKTID